MLQVTKIFLADQSAKEHMEESIHADAFEYLPDAKGYTYSEITGDSACTMLIVKLQKNNSNESAPENEIINTGMFMRILAATNQIFSEWKNGIMLKSACYNRDSEENDENTMVCYACVCKNDNTKVTDAELSEFAGMMAEKLGISNMSVPGMQRKKQGKEQTEQKTEQKSESLPKNSVDSNMYVKQNNATEMAAHTENQEQNAAPVAESVSTSNINADKDDDSPLSMFDGFDMSAPMGFKSENVNIKDYSAENKYEENADAESQNNKNEDTPQFDLGGFFGDFLKDDPKDSQEDEILARKTKTDVPMNGAKGEKDSDKPDATDAKPTAPEVKVQTVSLKESPDEKLEKTVETDKKVENSKKDKDIPFLNMIDTFKPDISLENKILYYDLKDIDSDKKTTFSKEKLNQLFSETINYFTTSEKNFLKRTQAGEIPLKNFMNGVVDYVHRTKKIPPEDEKFFFEKIERCFFSYYVLIPAINDPNITDIKVLSPDHINVKINGKQHVVRGLNFISRNDYDYFIAGLLIRNKIKVNSPIILFTDTMFDKNYNLRFDITFPELNVSKMPTLHIRKEPKEKLNVEGLVQAGMMPEKVATYLKYKVKTAKGVVFAGPSASGKTYALNAFADEIPFDSSVLCVQESDEIFSKVHPNFMSQHILRDAKGNVCVGLDQIGENGLVCDIKYFLIGEIKGSEARSFLRACNTGHRCMCTIHTPSAKETLPRFADYIKYGADYSMEEAERMLKDLEVIVYIENFKIQEITEITGYDEEKKKIVYNTVYRRDMEKSQVA